MLGELIGRCDALIHLAGSYYGAEPPQRPRASRAAPTLKTARNTATGVLWKIAAVLASE